MAVKPLQCGLLLLPLTSVATAQTEEPKTMDRILVQGERETPESQAATRLPLALRETPQSVTVITSKAG